MRVVHLLVLIFTLSSVLCGTLEYFRLSFPAEAERPKIDFNEDTWLQLHEGPNWKEWRLDFYFNIKSVESYEKILAEMPNISQYFRCNLPSRASLRCIVFGQEIVKQIATEEKDGKLYYSIQLDSNGYIDILITENVSQTKDIIDSIIAHKDPEVDGFLVSSIN